MSTSRILSVESWTLRIFWPHYLGKYRTVGTCVLLRNHGRVTASRRTEKTVDTQHLRVDWLRIHSAKGDVTRSIGTARTLYSDLNALIYDTLIQYQQNYCVMIMILHGLVKFIKIARYHITINLQNNVIQSSVRHAHLQQHTRDFRWSLLTSPTTHEDPSMIKEITSAALKYSFIPRFRSHVFNHFQFCSIWHILPASFVHFLCHVLHF